MDLVRGQRVKLSDLTPASKIDVSLKVAGIDAGALRFLCLLVNRAERVVDGQEVLFEGRRNSRCGSVTVKERTPGEQVFTLDLARTPEDAARYVFVLSVVDPTHSKGLYAGAMREGSMALSVDGRELATYRFSGSDFGRETALLLGEVYRKDAWRLGVLGSGFLGGLGALLSRYHVPQGLVTSVEKGEQTLAPAVHGLVLPKVWPGAQAPAIPKGLVPAVGLVVVEREDGETATGTGFVISPGGYFLTCYHVVEGAKKIAIALDGTGQLRTAVGVNGDPTHDVALLWIEDRNGATHWMQLAPQGSTPSLGDNLGLLGYPLGTGLGLDVTYSQGIVNSVRKLGERAVLQIDAGAAPGSSGGPVFNRADGTVVGMLSSGLTSHQGGMLVNFAVDLRVVWTFGWFQGAT